MLVTTPHVCLLERGVSTRATRECFERLRTSSSTAESDKRSGWAFSWLRAEGVLEAHR